MTVNSKPQKNTEHWKENKASGPLEKWKYILPLWKTGQQRESSDLSWFQEKTIGKPKLIRGEVKSQQFLFLGKAQVPEAFPVYLLL